MGIKGTAHRKQDGHFINANIDLDIIITEEPPIGTTHECASILVLDIRYHRAEERERGRVGAV